MHTLLNYIWCVCCWDSLRWRIGQLMLSSSLSRVGRDWLTRTKDYRPTSLPSFLLKTLMRLADLYMRDVVLAATPFQDSQHAYRESRLVDSALHALGLKTCRKVLRRLVNYNWVHLVWIPRHAGIRGNEGADRSHHTLLFIKVIILMSSFLDADLYNRSRIYKADYHVPHFANVIIY